MIGQRNLEKRGGFTLLELLLSMAIFLIIMLLVSQLTSATLGSWVRISDRDSQFRETKAAFDSISNRLSSAELNPYWGFEHPDGDSSRSPIGFNLLSDLHFVIGGTADGTGSSPALLPDIDFTTHGVFFHGSFGRTEQPDLIGLGSLINAWGYYIEFSSDNDRIAGFLTTEGNVQSRSRFRLMELQTPSEELVTFKNENNSDQLDLDEATSSSGLFGWFRSGIDNGRSAVLAENIVALIFTPLPADEEGDSDFDPTTLAPNYYYDSRATQHGLVPIAIDLANSTKHRLPPSVRVTMVAISEQSAVALEDENGADAPDFGLDTLFQQVEDYQADIETLEATLIEAQVSYRFFSNTVRLRNASRNQL